MTANPFANIPNEAFEQGAIDQNPPTETVEQAAPGPQTEKPKAAIKAGSKSAFQPADSSDFGGEMGDAMPFSEDDIFDFIGGQLDEKLNEAGQGGGAGQSQQKPPTYANTKKATAVGEVIDPDEAQMTAVFYVELLQMATVIVCEWISGVPGGYKFKEHIKNAYTDITAKLIVHEKVQVSPMQLFLIATVLLLGWPIWQAFKDKKKIAKQIIYAEKSKKATRSENGQTSLFEVEPMDTQRKSYKPRTIDGVHYYDTDRLGKYAKKDELEEIPPELSKFIFDYEKQRGKWPDKKAVDTFLKFAA